MGTWSHEPFGNDTASDWAYEFEEHNGYDVIEDAFDQIIDMTTEEFIDADLDVLRMQQQRCWQNLLQRVLLTTNITLNL